MAEPFRFVPIITTGYYSIERQTYFCTCPNCKLQQDIDPVTVLHDPGTDPVPVAVGCERCRQALTVMCGIEERR